MNEILADVTAVAGINGAFVCDTDGRIVSRSLPKIFDDEMVGRIGGITARTLGGLETSGATPELDLVYSDGRLLIKNLGVGALCILCEQDSNVSFLNLTANVASSKLRERLEGPGATADPEPEPSKLDRMRAVVSSLLGKHATKGLEILSKAEESDRGLSKACDEVERMTRLFISKKKADELVGGLRLILNELGPAPSSRKGENP